jgi:hypothetical protein
MKQFSLLGLSIALIGVLFLVGCSKDEAKKISKCLPATFTSTGVDFFEITYVYNSSDQLTTYSFINTKTGATGTHNITYDTKGNVIKDESQGENFYYSYTYNDKNLLIRADRFYKSSNTLDFRYDYEYNVSNQFIKNQYSYTSSGALIKGSYKTYEYTTSSDKNAIRLKDFSATDILQSITEYEYDDKKIPGKDSGFSLSVTSENNITKETEKNASGTTTLSTKMTIYQYNENGYPTQAVSTLTSSSTGVTASTRTYTYTCK